MRDYSVLLKKKADSPDPKTVQQDIEAAGNWNEAYQIGRFLYDQKSGEADRLIIDAYEKAFRQGLNIRVNRACFLTATQDIARIYFQFRMYDEAINKLMVLDSNTEEIPDWVNLYYASAQIHTETILYWAEMPEILFRRIDGINESDPESVKRRKYLFLEFLNRISELSKTKDVSSIDKDAILLKAEELGVSESRECLGFKAALGIIPEMPELPDTPQILETQDIGTKPETEAKQISVYEQMAAELNRRLADVQAAADKQSLTIAELRKRSEDQQRQIADLKAENAGHQQNIADQRNELKAAREREYAANARCRALESQLSGSEAARKQLEENASVIGELQVDVEDLKTAIAIERRKNEKLLSEIGQNQETIRNLQEELLQSQEEAQSLHTTIETQKTRIEVAEAAVKAAEEREISIRESRASEKEREKTASETAQPTLRDILAIGSALPRNQKILIIGGSETKETHLRGKLKSMGFNFSKDQLEFELEYDNVSAYSARIIPWGGKYAGIIVGPCPHKAKDTEGYSSFIQKLKAEEGYPYVVEARDKSGTLKISNASIGDAMLKMAVYLQSIA